MTDSDESETTVSHDARETVAAALFDAYRSGTPIDPPREDHDLTLADGYAVQQAVTERRRTGEGPPVGYKVGFTSETIRDELGVEAPAYGCLLRDTVLTEGALEVDSLVDPEVEAELAFRLGEALPAPATPGDVLAATDAVLPAIEVVDSRVADWDVTAPEAVVDNALAARVVLGGRGRDPTTLGTDLALEGVQVRTNGEAVATGVGADVLGHPARVVAWLAGALADHGSRLAAGDLVLTGSMTPLVPLADGDTVEVRFANFGSVTLRGA